MPKEVGRRRESAAQRYFTMRIINVEVYDVSTGAHNRAAHPIVEIPFSRGIWGLSRPA
ncbi:MAG: hypothetical protein WD076_03110 [Parvularculaceae bacterium]